MEGHGDMPELFRHRGFIFMFFTHEHEPVHVHVRGNDGDAKYDWNGQSFVRAYAHHIKANDLKRIEQVIAENTDIILKRWKELFGESDE